MRNDSLEEFADVLRADAVTMSYRAGATHLGSSLSCADIVATLYAVELKLDPTNPQDDERDRFILSKGHAVAVLYAALARQGFFDVSLLCTYGSPHGALAEHPLARAVPGVEFATGSLGHGLSLAIGTALAGRIQRKDFRVFTLLSDGEMNEGSVWEGAMMAAGQQLSRLCAIVDYNKWQATGRSDDVLALSPLAEKWSSFGWNVIAVDGHDVSQLRAAFHAFNLSSSQPTAIIAHTVKGKGVSFMEDDNNWHYRVPSEVELRLALAEIRKR